MSNQPKSVSWFQLFQLGQHYMKTWPVDKCLTPVFPENRIIGATRFAVRYMPPLAVLTLAWQMAWGGQMSPAVATALFACTLPMQGLWWLGKRSVTPLPPPLLHWFHEVRAKLLDTGQMMASVTGKPTYQSLAEVLRCAFGQLDRTFLNDL